MRVVLIVGLLALAAAATAQGARLPRLSVRQGEDAAIVDARGRQVLLRGVNVNQLGDYYQADPSLPTVIALQRRDFRKIGRLGFNVVRLVMNWSGYQPERGAFDTGYVARVRRAVRWAAESGLYVVLDMHQDAWGKFIATPAGETCLPGLGRAVGWDGAPEWATLTDGLSTCRLNDTRELSPAVAQAFESFYADRDGIQSELVATWGRIATAFAREPNVIGYDLINEPHPGLKVGVNQSGPLGEYYTRAIAAIRAAETEAGLPARIAFFEPSVLWSGVATDALPPPGFTDDDQIVFAPHLYAESITVDQGLTSVEGGWDNAARAAASYGAPLWSGEWGWFTDPAESRERLERYIAQEDARRVGGAWWVWRQACGDPHVVGYPGASGSLNPTDCPSGRRQGLVKGYTRLLSRAYPRFAPGRLTALESDWESGRWSLEGTAGNAASCRVAVWVPARRPRVRGGNVTRVRIARRPGGFVVSGCARGGYALRGRPA